MRTYKKEINITLECKANNRDEATEKLNQVAHGIHSMGHPLTIGGKDKRKVSISHKSEKVTHVPIKIKMTK